jgi:soluble lytic murein transglycosylase-like protein
MPMPSPEEWAAKKAPVNHLENAIKAEGFTGRKADYIRATAQHESGGDPNAKSNKGATGIMQIMEGTFKANADKGWDYNNPAHNTHAGVREAGSNMMQLMVM